MNAEILIPISLFLAIFGIIYLYLSTRNKERLALIEKGVDKDGRKYYKIYYEEEK